MRPGDRIYVAGPYTQGDVAVNVANAIRAGNRLLDAGLIPYIPHLAHFWHLLTPHPYADWVRLDLSWLPACQALLRLPGRSEGADIEVELARVLGLEVYTEVETVLREVEEV